MQRLRTAVVLACLFGGLVLLIQQSGVLSAPGLRSVDDYVEYWSAGRLNISGGNPYDPKQLAPLQRETGRADGVPVMMWNPPYTLAIAMPLASLPYETSRAAWLLISVVALALSAAWLWRYFGGAENRAGVALLLAFTFYPTFSLLQMGQIPALVALGFAGFLRFEDRRPWIAGMFAALMAIKPHITYLFWLALVLGAALQRRWRPLLGATFMLAGATAVAALPNPAVLHQYAVAAATHPPTDLATPSLGGVLRWLLGPEHRYLQFLPVSLGLLWLGARWRRRWEWRSEAPMLALVSVVTASYGWPFDAVVLLASVVSLGVALCETPGPTSRVWVIVAGYATINGLAFASHSGSHLFDYFWLNPSLLLWYLAARRVLRQDAGRLAPGLPD